MGKNWISQLPSRITCVLEYSLAERNNSVNIAREKKTKQNPLHIYGIILYPCREDHKNTCLENMLGLSSMSFGLVVSLSCQCVAHQCIFVLFEGRTQNRQCVLKAASLYHQFAKWLQRTKVEGSESSSANSGKCFLYLTCCRESPKAFWVILQCHRAYSQSHFQHRSKIYSKISLWTGG